MIRIVGVQRGETPETEFVLLQNQGNLRVGLRGLCLIAEAAIDASDPSVFCHVFSDAEQVPPGQFVILYSGEGTSRWARSKDGSLVYHAYMRRARPVWKSVEGPLHVSVPHHTYVERGRALMLR